MAWLAVLPAFAASEPAALPVLLHWAQPEGRLVFNLSVAVKETAGTKFYESVTRIDLGSEINMILPTQACQAGGGHCGGKCANVGCGCAPQGLSMPAACPGGGKPTGKQRAKNGREYATCPSTDLDIKLGGTELHLAARDVGQVFYMTSVGQCEESAAAKTGFNGHAPFKQAVFSQLGSSVFSLSQATMKLEFGATVPTKPLARVPWSGSGPGGRLVTIIAVNGVPCGDGPGPAPSPGNCTASCSASMPSCDCHCYCQVCHAKCGNGCYDKCHGEGGCNAGCSPDSSNVAVVASGAAQPPVVAAIDSGNGAFLSFGPGSPLKAARQFPFNVTFEGGDTLVFNEAPKVNGHATVASQYSHNVLALGFMSLFTVTFDDEGHLVYFAEAN